MACMHAHHGMRFLLFGFALRCECAVSFSWRRRRETPHIRHGVEFQPSAHWRLCVVSKAGQLKPLEILRRGDSGAWCVWRRRATWTWVDCATGMAAPCAALRRRVAGPSCAEVVGAGFISVLLPCAADARMVDVDETAKNIVSIGHSGVRQTVCVPSSALLRFKLTLRVFMGSEVVITGLGMLALASRLLRLERRGGSGAITRGSVVGLPATAEACSRWPEVAVGQDICQR